MNNNRWLAPYINIGHFLDHLAMLIFPTVVLALARDWDRSYSELLPLTLGGFIAFGAFALPAGWLADHWSRYRMMLVFFFGIGASLVITGFANSPWEIGAGLTLVGVFAAIYHPVGIAMLVAAPTKLGAALGWNGLWGNLGLAAAALISGALMDVLGWRAAFFVPGALCLAAGVGFLGMVPDPGPVKKGARSIGLHIDRRTMTRIFTILLVTAPERSIFRGHSLWSRVTTIDSTYKPFDSTVVSTRRPWRCPRCSTSACASSPSRTSALARWSPSSIRWRHSRRWRWAR